MSKSLLGSLTSFVQLFGRDESGFVINSIEIPLIQRDFAQGRQGEVVSRIRTNFLDALSNALKPDGKAIGLDFVYGDVEKEGPKKGAFYPLDGQQRLTTLFLLHWYFAWRSHIEIKHQPWTNFRYATRPSARLFCERLAEFQPKAGELGDSKKLSVWLTDQSWYLHTWQNDPTIQSMLVILDDMSRRFNDWSREDCLSAWTRLTDEQKPAISFHLLSMEANRLTDDLYIKMNSRGKPLTAFENFKANFETLLKDTHSEAKTNDFATKVDTKWADTLWPYRGDDYLIDDEFMRYFRFIAEVCAWQSGVAFNHKPRTDDLAEMVFGKANIKATDNLDFLLQSFDIWQGKDIKGEFEQIFSSTYDDAKTGLLIFNSFKSAPMNESPVDLFAACCRSYGENRTDWTLSHTLLLFAVLLDRIHNQRENAADFAKQLRILRNLIEASGGGEIRDQKMPELLADVKRVVIDGTLQGVTTFNQAQVSNENEKLALLTQQPAIASVIYRLEDHVLLRGCLSAFDLDQSTASGVLKQRADAFHFLFSQPSCWINLTGALLAIGDYSRTQGQRFSDFGAQKNTDPWRSLLTGSRIQNLDGVLMALLDQLAAANFDLSCLQRIQHSYLQQCSSKVEMDWRYYFVKYPAMREGDSGRYVGVVGQRGGYSICMLNRYQMNSYYRDPYLFAMWRASDVRDVIAEPWPLFYGYETTPRKMVLKNSGLEIQCIDVGLQITNAPNDPTKKAAFDKVSSIHGIGQDGLLKVAQKNGVDTVDRVALGAAFLTDLVEAGL